MGVERPKPESDPILIDYDKLFSRPLLPPDPITIRHERDFFSRNREVIWWLVIFFAIGITAAVLLGYDYEVFAEPGCG